MLAALLGVALGVAACGDDEGVLHIVVTSDLSVPLNIDTIQWKVTLPGDTAPNTTEFVFLDDAGDLPVSLYVVHGSETKGPVRVRVTALWGGAEGLPRVTREIEVLVPASGEKTVWVPLNWLCSDSNLDSPCEEGRTCVAGQCRKIESEPAPELPASEEASQAECFDVEQCFDGAQPVALDLDTCQFDLRDEGISAENLNVALWVDPWRAGATGVCSWGGQCLVALDQESPQGWTTLRGSNGNATAIQLPMAVCDAYGKTLLGVVVPGDEADCPSKRGGMAVCQSEAACVAHLVSNEERAEGPCPADWPDAWQGYSCVGETGPDEKDEDLLSCESSAVNHELSNDATPTTHYCCTRGETPSEDDAPLLIDDMSSGPEIDFDFDDDRRGGFWFTYTAGDDASVVPHPGDLFTYRSIENAMTKNEETEELEPVDITKAACIHSDGTSGYWSGMGFDFLATVESFDVSEYAGIEFWAQSAATTPLLPEFGASVKVEFPNEDTRGGDLTAACNQASVGEPEGCSDQFSIQDLQLRSYWTHHRVEWCYLEQSPQKYGKQFDEFNTNVFGVNFTHQGPGGSSQPFDYCVADLYFLDKEESTCPD